MDDTGVFLHCFLNVIRRAKSGKQSVVIDAGHGGKDAGAIGGNVKEKDITLDVSKKVEKTSLYEKWFGASGFYAHRNSQRGRGSGTLVFIAIFISTMTILTFLSFADSLKASMLKALGGKADEYREIISTEKRTYMYDAEWNDSLRSILEGKDKVTDTFSVMYSDQHVDINESPYFYNEELKRLSDNGHGPVSHVYEMGCNAEDMEKA